MKFGFDAKRIFHNTTGLGNYSRDLVRVLSNYFPENKYLLYNPKPKKVTRLQLSDTLEEVLPQKWIWKKLPSFWRQGPMIHQLQNDDIHLYHGLSGEIPRCINKTKIKTIVTIHDLIFMRYPELYSYFDRKIHCNKFNYSAHHSDTIIAISEQTKRDIVQFLNVDANKVEVIYQGCHSVFKKEQSYHIKQEVIAKYNLPNQFILNVGTVEKRKNVLTLIKAIKDMDTSLVIVGRKTDYQKEIDAYITAYNLGDKVYFLEGLELQEIAALYQIAALFVYPSIFEGFGIPIIEALYSKTPVITSIDGCFAEAGGPHSIYVDPLDVMALKKQIIAVLSDTTKQQVMIENGFEFVQKFNDETIANNIMDVYNRTLA